MWPPEAMKNVPSCQPIPQQSRDDFSVLRMNIIPLRSKAACGVKDTQKIVDCEALENGAGVSD